MVIYICAPLRGDVEENIRTAAAAARLVAMGGGTPICPHTMFRGVLKADDARQDETAMRCCLELISRCDAVFVYGKPTKGMLQEIAEATRLKIPVDIIEGG